MSNKIYKGQRIISDVLRTFDKMYTTLETAIKSLGKEEAKNNTKIVDLQTNNEGIATSRIEAETVMANLKKIRGGVLATEDVEEAVDDIH